MRVIYLSYLYLTLALSLSVLVIDFTLEVRYSYLKVFRYSFSPTSPPSEGT